MADWGTHAAIARGERQPDPIPSDPSRLKELTALKQLESAAHIGADRAHKRRRRQRAARRHGARAAPRPAARTHCMRAMRTSASVVSHVDGRVCVWKNSESRSVSLGPWSMLLLARTPLVDGIVE